MGCRNTKLKIRGNPHVSRALFLKTTPSKMANIPASDLDVMRAVVQSTCLICDLKLRPEVYAFLEKDLPLFHNVTLEDGGEDETTLLLLNKDDKILKSFKLWDKSREECNLILEGCGFYRKLEHGEPVPEEFLNGPYGIVFVP